LKSRKKVSDLVLLDLTDLLLADAEQAKKLEQEKKGLFIFNLHD
jgi:hypothetical protein